MNSNYELETLLELREQALSQAQEVYAESIRALETARTLLASKVDARKRREEEEQREVEAFDDDFALGNVSLQDRLLFHDYRSGSRIELEEMDLEIERAREQTLQRQRESETARKALGAASADLEAIKKHKESWLAEHSKVASRKAETQQDEIAMRRWRDTHDKS